MSIAKLLVARGGRGGIGNARRGTPQSQVPLLAEGGERGEQVTLLLELKIPADVALLGLTNAGKSSLLAACSASRPVVADYPFTTREPILGTVERGWKSIIMVEIPALVAAASEGKGLGNQSLRHVERAQLLVLLLDGTSSDPKGDYDTVIGELGRFNSALLRKRRLVVISKMDLPLVREQIPDVKQALEAVEGPLLFISAATGEGVSDLLDRMECELDSLPRESSVATPRRSIAREESVGPRVAKEGGVFVVRYARAQRLAAIGDMRDWRVRVQMRRELVRMGVGKMLEEAGIQPGDKVRLGQVEMEW